jgi:serine-type D-Ala-D-Ala carboxypeptidase (penicillin-binding protein 5/6)
MKRSLAVAGVFLLTAVIHIPELAAADALRGPALTAVSAVVIDSNNGGVLYSKNASLRLPPASTAKVMTALIALERLPFRKEILIDQHAANVSPSKAGLTPHVRYKAIDLVIAALVASSNDAAVALAEEVSGSEKEFANLMNQRARLIGMNDTKFINPTGLTERGYTQYSTAMDLAKLMRVAAKNKLIDQIMGFTMVTIRGSDGRAIVIRSHNKMLWRTPGFVKGKTGWTFASRHTFVGTDYAPDKKITFAMLHSKKPWADIERLATFGLFLEKQS